MSTVIRFRHMNFIILSGDHEPAHIHVKGLGAHAKIEIETLNVIFNHGFTKPSMHRILEKMVEERDLLRSKWNEINGKEEN